MAEHSPAPWTVGYHAMDVTAFDEERGPFKICDIRGWGYLTGGGIGALGLPHPEAKAIQEANAALISAAPELLKVLKAFVAQEVDYMTINNLGDPEKQHNVIWARAVIAKAEHTTGQRE